MTGSPRPWWYWPLRIGVLLASIAVAFTIVEIVLRMTRPPSEGAAFFDKAPDGLEVPYVLRAGAEVRFEGHYVPIPATTVRINQQGLRADREYATPKPSGIRRILVLGDSFVFGSGVESGETFAARLESARRGLEVLNLGVPGYTSTHAVELLAKRGLRFEPDGVVLFISDNDFYSEGRDRLRERQAKGEEWAVERYVDGQLQRRRKAESHWRKNPEKVLRRLRRAVDRLAALGREHGFPVRIFLLFPHPLERDILEWKLGITRLTDTAYLRDMVSLQIPKDLHPNAEGHRRLSVLLARALAGWPGQ